MEEALREISDSPHPLLEFRSWQDLTILGVESNRVLRREDFRDSILYDWYIHQLLGYALSKKNYVVVQGIINNYPGEINWIGLYGVDFLRDAMTEIIISQV